MHAGIAARARFGVLVAASLLGLIAGCTRVWHLAVSFDDSGQMIFCFSRWSGCRGQGVQFSSLEIARVDAEGNRAAVVWSIQGKSDEPSDYVIKKLQYGVAPKGWVQVRAPEPLQTGVYYGVEEQYFFRIEENKQIRVYPREEFFETIVR